MNEDQVNWSAGNSLNQNQKQKLSFWDSVFYFLLYKKKEKSI